MNNKSYEPIKKISEGMMKMSLRGDENTYDKKKSLKSDDLPEKKVFSS